MGVRSDRDDPAAEMMIAGEDFRTGVRFTQPVMKSAGIDLQTDVFADQFLQQGVQDFCMIVKTEVCIFAGTVPNDVVQMPIDIKI